MIEKLQEFLRTSTVGKQFLAAQAQEELDERKALVAKLVEVTARAARELPKLREKAEAKKALMKRAEEALVAATRDYREAYGASFGEAQQVNHERGRIERQLRDTADPSIGAFCQEMRDDLEQIRQGGIKSFTEPTRQLNIMTMKRVEGVYSNRSGTVAALDARLAAIPQAEALALEALTAEELQVRLDAIRATLPQPGEPVKVA